ARPLRERAVWTTVNRDDPRVVDHLVEDHDVAGRLNDLEGVVVGTGDHRRTRVEAEDASIDQAQIFRVVEDAGGRAGRPLRHLRACGRRARNATVGRVDD